MRLVDLDPSWSALIPCRHGMGITFLCPHCLTQYLGVWFANPLDGESPAPIDQKPVHRWVRIGETFEDLTLTPSIDARTSGHWHGNIINGEIIA